MGTKATNVKRWLLICSCAHDPTLAFWHGWTVQAVLFYCRRFMEEGGEEERDDAENLRIRSYRL